VLDDRRGRLSQDLDVRLRSTLQIIGYAVERVLVDAHLQPRSVHKLAELDRREGRVLRSAPRDDVDVVGLVPVQFSQHRRGHVGHFERVGRLGQNSGDVDGDVSDADHRSSPHAAEVLRGGVRMPGIPSDELARRPAARQVLPRDAELGILSRARGIHNGVVGREKLLARDVSTELDVADEADAAAVEGAGQRVGDRLDARVVRRDAVAQQAIRRRQPVDEVHLHRKVALPDQRLGGKQPGRAGPDNRNPADVPICTAHRAPPVPRASTLTARA
jgi:hypothetical protein